MTNSWQLIRVRCSQQRVTSTSKTSDNMMLRFLTALILLSSLTKANGPKLVKEVPLTVVQLNLTHLRISWKTQLNNIGPVYILTNESKINPYPNNLKEGEAHLKLNPCESHSLCLGRPPICVTTITTYIPAGGKQCQSNTSKKHQSIQWYIITILQIHLIDR